MVAVISLFRGFGELKVNVLHGLFLEDSTYDLVEALEIEE